MNMNTLKADYEAEKAIRVKYMAAEDDAMSQTIETVRKEYKELTDKIQAKGEEYQKMYQLYSDMRDRGNDYIDLTDTQEQDVKKTVEMFRRYGIKSFTFSSTWSGAVDTSWAFIQNGCLMTGMAEINGLHKKFMSNEYEKAPAYVFTVS